MNKQDDQSSADNKELSELYKLQATEQPSPELDQKILALAKAAAKTDKKIRLKSYNFLPYTVAASMAIAGLLFLSFPEYYQIKQPTIEPDFESLTPSETISGQAEAFSSPQTKEANRQAPANLQSTAPPQVATSELMADQAISEDKKLNTVGITAVKQRMSAKKSDVTELSLAQQQTIEKLLKENKKQQAIILLKQLQQQNPQLVLPQKYQLLVDSELASEQ